MNLFNYIIDSIFDLFFYPYRNIDPIYGLCAVSFLTVMIILPVFKYTSNQEAIKMARDRIIGHLLEVRLFKDDINVVLSAQKNMVKYNMIYLLNMLKPLLFIFFPVTIILIQTSARYEYRPLRQGETAIVKIKLDTLNGIGGKAINGVLTLTDGLVIETPPLRINGGEEIYWRIRAEKEGEFFLGFQALDEEIRKRVIVGDRFTKLFPRILRGTSIPDDSVVEFFEIKYPSMKIEIFGWHICWLALFFIFSFSFGFLLMKPFNVRI